jgi:hypothetical protein
MIFKKTLLFVAMTLISLALCSCVVTRMRTKPIANFQNQSVPAHLTTEQVKDSIKLAGAEKNWHMQEVNPGLIRGTLRVRDHSATVNIPYSNHSYSINYVSSTNLLASDGTIHRNYNTWVKNLNISIQHRLWRTASK